MKIIDLQNETILRGLRAMGVYLKTATKDNDVFSEEYVYNCTDFPYREYLFTETAITKKGKQRITYLNISSAFDIETTTIDGTKDNKGKYVKNPIAFMYHWQFCLHDKVCFGRTWAEFKTLLKRLERELMLSETRRLVIYVHNLAFEFQFIKDFINISELFAKEKRKPIKFLANNCIEFRCSYFLSNMSLQKFCENSKLCKHYKLTDTYDYKKIRTYKTPLTETEQQYCYNDVRGLCENIETLMLEDNIATMPLTNTGFVRREARNATKCDRNYRDVIKTLSMDIDQYEMCRRAFRGGNTHASRFYSNTILHDVYSYDLQSSYPAVIDLEYYPMSQWYKVTLDTPEKISKYCSKYCVIMDIEFFDIKIKDVEPIPYIDLAHCQKISNDYTVDNGRILEASYISMSMTEIDLDIILRTYDIDEYFITNAYYAKRGKLPVVLRNAMLDYYDRKTKLKGIDSKEYEYMKSKNRLNSFFGMMVSAIIHDEIIYNAESHEWQKVAGDSGELDKYNKSRNTFLAYQWGIYVTAHARKRLQQMIDIVGIDVIYVDTDSVKFINKKHCEEFDKMNDVLIKQCHDNDIRAYSVKDNKTYYLGVWDFDGHYDLFKTCGAKKYVYENETGFHCTVSGMSKKLGAAAIGSVQNFNIGTTYENVGRTVAYYNEASPHEITINGDTFMTASNIGIVDTTYTLGVTKEYWEIICDNFSKKEVDILYH